MTEQPEHSPSAIQPAAPGEELFPNDLAGLMGLTLAEGQAFVARQGAQVLSWRDRQGRERLYLSPQTGGYRRGDPVNALHQPIRGGIPISFPQFSGRGPLPKHGFARNLLWQRIAPPTQPAGASANTSLFILGDTAHTQPLWPHPFRTELAVSIESDQLLVALSITNSGNSAWSFTVALHTYLRVADIRHTALTGLQGVTYQDATAANTEVIQKEPELHIAGEVDRVYMTPPSPLVLLENGTPSLRIEQQGFCDTVVWNPGPANARALKDFPDADWQHMLCVEAACAVQPVTLQPGTTWHGRQLLTAITAAR